MTEAIYKVGDILEFTEVVPRQFGLWTGPVRGLVVKINDPGYEYISYRLLLCGCLGDMKDMVLHWVFEKGIVSATKRVGHIDISALMFMENDEPDYEKMFAALRQELAGTYKENKMLKNENEVLKRENEELRSHNEKLEQALSKSEERADSRLDRITFLMQKVDELENANKKQKAECDEANHEISRLRTVIGGLNDVIDDLNASKSEISDLFCSLKNALQTNEILEGVNELKNENERLNNENKNLKAMNDELRSSWIECCTSCKQTDENKKLMDENAKLSLKLYDADEKAHKLEEENGKLAQKISCADKLLAEAANRLYQGRAHLNISAHN
jgi:chromosome segregation ATPase